MGVIKKPELGVGLLTRAWRMKASLKRELLGLGRYPVPSYGGVSMGIIRVKGLIVGIREYKPLKSVMVGGSKVHIKVYVPY